MTQTAGGGRQLGASAGMTRAELAIPAAKAGYILAPLQRLPELQRSILRAICGPIRQWSWARLSRQTGSTLGAVRRAGNTLDLRGLIVIAGPEDIRATVAGRSVARSLGRSAATQLPRNVELEAAIMTVLAPGRWCTLGEIRKEVVGTGAEIQRALRACIHDGRAHSARGSKVTVYGVARPPASPLASGEASPPSGRVDAATAARLSAIVPRRRAE